VSFLRSASGSGKESGRGTERGTSSEAGEWLRYDFNSGFCALSAFYFMNCVFFILLGFQVIAF
jgi:hypothetical protein